MQERLKALLTTLHSTAPTSADGIIDAVDTIRDNERKLALLTGNGTFLHKIAGRAIQRVGPLVGYTRLQEDVIELFQAQQEQVTYINSILAQSATSHQQSVDDVGKELQSLIQEAKQHECRVESSLSQVKQTHERYQQTRTHSTYDELSDAVVAETELEDATSTLCRNLCAHYATDQHIKQVRQRRNLSHKLLNHAKAVVVKTALVQRELDSAMRSWSTIADIGELVGATSQALGSLADMCGHIDSHYLATVRDLQTYAHRPTLPTQGDIQKAIQNLDEQSRAEVARYLC